MICTSIASERTSGVRSIRLVISHNRDLGHEESLSWTDFTSSVDTKGKEDSTSTICFTLTWIRRLGQASKPRALSHPHAQTTLSSYTTAPCTSSQVTMAVSATTTYGAALSSNKSTNGNKSKLLELSHSIGLATQQSSSTTVCLSLADGMATTQWTTSFNTRSRQSYGSRSEE